MTPGCRAPRRGIRDATGTGRARLGRRPPDPGRPKNAHVREDQILPHLAALAILHGDQNQGRPGGTMQVTAPGEVTGLIDQLRTAGITLTYDPDTRTIRTGDSGIAAVTVGQHRSQRPSLGDVPVRPDSGGYGVLSCPRT
jgi:hypothetical protein